MKFQPFCKGYNFLIAVEFATFNSTTKITIYFDFVTNYTKLVKICVICS
jgi:hypothetical protein